MGRAGLDLDARVVRGSFAVDAKFAVAPGEVLGVLGPNGAGKTSLLRAVAGLESLERGRITLDGTVLDDPARGAFVPAARRPVGVVFQDLRLFPGMSVRDNVAFSPRARGLGRAAAATVASSWLDRLDIADLAERRPSRLSGGQAQRVALARALAGAPSLLLLDEPLSSLDARARLDVQDVLRRHLADFPGPCLLVTHDPLEALVLADRLLVLEGGRVVQEGDPATVARRPATDYVARLVGLNLYAGEADGAVVSLRGGGVLVVPDHGLHGPVLASVRPSSVVVTADRPDASSARNVWPATVTGMSTLADRVRLDVRGAPDALVDVTPSAVADLCLAVGSEVWLSVKAMDIEVYGREDRAEPAEVVAG